MTQRTGFFNFKLASSIRNAELQELHSFGHGVLEVNHPNDVHGIEELAEPIQ